MLQWACASIGAILVTLNPAYRLPELVRCSSISQLFEEQLMLCVGWYALPGRRIPSLHCSQHPLVFLHTHVRRSFPIPDKLSAWVNPGGHPPTPQAPRRSG